MADTAVQRLVFPLGSFPLPEEWPQLGKLSQITHSPCSTFSSLVHLTGTHFNKTAGSRLDFAAYLCPHWGSANPCQLKSRNHNLTRNEAVKDDTVKKRGTMLCLNKGVFLCQTLCANKLFLSIQPFFLFLVFLHQVVPKLEKREWVRQAALPVRKILFTGETS